MYDTLFDYLKRHASGPIDADQFELIRSVFTPMKIKKRQFFLEEGEVCKRFAFVVKGAMRQYTLDEKGAEHIVHLGLENWWVGDRESWVMGSPTIYYIDAWEDSDLLLVTRENITKLLRDVPAFSGILRVLDDRNKIASQKRITSAISSTAEKRYQDFVECHPDFMRRFPQRLIASYLGITKETLSRIRKQALRK